MYYAQMDAQQRAAYDQEQRKWLQRQKDFVRNSELISGVGYIEGVDVDGQELFFQIPEVKRHLDLAKTLNRVGGNYVGIWLINWTLTGTRENCMRTGIQGMSKGFVPEGKDVPGFLDALDKKLKAEFVTFCDASQEEKDELAWHAHDEVMCSDLFKALNGRTARLVLNHCRTIFGLDTFVVEDAKSVEYFAKLQRYKQQVYLPKLGERQKALVAA